MKRRSYNKRRIIHGSFAFRPDRPVSARHDATTRWTSCRSRASDDLSQTARRDRRRIERVDGRPPAAFLEAPHSQRAEISDHLVEAIAVEVAAGDAVGGEAVELLPRRSILPRPEADARTEIDDQVGDA